MTLSNALTDSLTAAAILLGLLLAFGLLSFRWRRYRSRPRREQTRLLTRYVAIRAIVAVVAGLALFVLVTAALTLNTHRPPGDPSPTIKLTGVSGPVEVHLSMPDCSGKVSARLVAQGRSGSDAMARIYSDADGIQQVSLNGRGDFELSDPGSKRGLLSCYIQMPVVSGNRGSSTVKLSLAESMEVDTMASAPAPTGYFSGSWQWRCPAGQTCPAMATVQYAIEDGTKQVIVLVLAAVFGAIIAVFIGETVIVAVRRRLDRDVRPPE